MTWRSLSTGFGPGSLDCTPTWRQVCGARIVAISSMPLQYAAALIAGLAGSLGLDLLGSSISLAKNLRTAALTVGRHGDIMKGQSRTLRWSEFRS